jgi:hypothetical protein
MILKSEPVQPNFAGPKFKFTYKPSWNLSWAIPQIARKFQLSISITQPGTPASKFGTVTSPDLEIKELTNTLKPIYHNEQNTKKISYLGVEEFYIPHVFSVYIFYLWLHQKSHQGNICLLFIQISKCWFRMRAFLQILSQINEEKSLSYSVLELPSRVMSRRLPLLTGNPIWAS